MTAAELYNIVKPHPEAWPTRVKYWSATGTPRFYWEGGAGLSHTDIHADLALDAFDASFMRVLGSRGCSAHYIDDTWRVRLPKDKQDDLSETDLRYTWTIAYPTLIEALAAALTALKGAADAT